MSINKGTDSREIFFGVLDSGVGGFSVARPLLEYFPNCWMTYVADTAHVPYSNKTPAELKVLVGKILTFFIQERVDVVIFACNTSSALVLPFIENSYPIPVFGVVKPGITEALRLTQGNGIGVVANEVTARSGIFKKFIHEHDKSIQVVEVGCPELVFLVENNDLDSPAVLKQVRECCSPLMEKCDTVIYGCTHFPFLAHHFKEVMPKATFVDPGILLAEEVKEKLNKGEIFIDLNRKGIKRKILTTKPSPHVSKWAYKVLDWETNTEVLDLDSLTSWFLIER